MWLWRVSSQQLSALELRSVREGDPLLLLSPLQVQKLESEHVRVKVKTETSLFLLEDVQRR